MKQLCKGILILFLVGLTNTLALEPPSLFNASWADLSIFKRDLVSEWQDVTEDLTDLPIYHLKLELSHDLASIKGQQEVLFTNTHSEALEELVFRLYPNTLGSSLEVVRVELEGVLAIKRLEQDASVLRVFLSSPLAPSEQIVVRLNFETRVGQSELGYGRLGRYDEVLSLAHGYPVLAAQQNGQWLTAYPSAEGDPVVTSAAYHMVQVSAPRDQTLVASGTLIEVFEEADMQTLTFVTGPAREFFLASTTGYQQLSLVAGETVIHAYFPERYARSAQQSLEAAANALELFSSFTPYPYRELDMVAAPMQASGIEFPGVFTLSNRLVASPQNNLESVIVHETAHQWSYNLVGSDQVLEPWLDEAVAQYLTLLYQQEYKTETFVQGYLAFWKSIWQDAPNETEPIGLAVAEYSPETYSSIVYGRGLFFFQALADLIGEDVLEEALGFYYQAYAWQFASANDFKGVVEATCGCDLTPLFQEWVDASF